MVGYAVATWQAIEPYKLVNKAALIIQTGGTLITSVFAILMGLASQGGDLSRHPLPASPYRHPAK